MSNQKYTSSYDPDRKKRFVPEEPYTNEFGERINRGRSYKSYLQEQYPHLSIKKIRERDKPENS